MGDEVMREKQEIVSEVLPERKEGEKTSEYLRRLQGEGYFFHGSTDPGIKVLKPREPYDPGREWNSKEAVYATSLPEWAVIFGLYDGKKAGASWMAGPRKEGVWAKIRERDKELVKGAEGVVYILPGDSFDKDPENMYQARSLTQVKPLGLVKVKYEDYVEMGGVVEWVDEVVF